jgi:hypothetical protein
MVTVQGTSVPLQSPLHVTEFVVTPFGVPVSVTIVPGLYVSVQSSGQLIPGGSLPTVPSPETVTVKMGLVKVAVTILSLFIVTVHGSALQAPDHPPNTESAAGSAVSVTLVPAP